MRKIDKIILHCSATRPNMDVGVKEIRDWHVRGNKWSDIGYHFVIRRNGKTETGRSLDKVGAHVAGHNTGSIGICLVGGVSQADYTKAENNFTKAQWAELKRMLRMLKARFPKATIHGHNEFAAKACPSFDVQKWLKENPL